MIKGWQIFIWDETAQDYIGGETFRDALTLSMACYKLGILRTEIEVREVRINDQRQNSQHASRGAA